MREARECKECSGWPFNMLNSRVFKRSCGHVQSHAGVSLTALSVHAESYVAFWTAFRLKLHVRSLLVVGPYHAGVGGGLWFVCSVVFQRSWRAYQLQMLHACLALRLL